MIFFEKKRRKKKEIIYFLHIPLKHFLDLSTNFYYIDLKNERAKFGKRKFKNLFKFLSNFWDGHTHMGRGCVCVSL